MKRTLTAMVLVVTGAACGDENGAVVGPGPDFELVWSDEFEGPAGQAIDAEFWTHDIGGDGWGNEQLEFNTSRPSNSSLDGNGNLAIVAREESFGGNDYTSARIKTQDKLEVEYGRIEARIQLPRGRGIWPAFWMLGGEPEDWPRIGEIDIMENRGRDTNVILGSVHGPGYSGGEAITKRYRREEDDGFDADFHIYRVDWDPGRIAFSVDDEVYQTITPFTVNALGDWVFDGPFYLLLNVAVGGTFVAQPDDSTQFPQTMLVDYVRVYERAR